MAGVLAAVGSFFGGGAGIAAGAGGALSAGSSFLAGAGVLGGLGGLDQLIGGGGGGLSALLGAGGGGGGGGMGGGPMGIANIISGLYGFDQSRKLQKSMRPPNPGDVTKTPGYEAGLEAVQRSMGAQGYQGSGNMMAALQKYGGDAYNQHWQNSMGSAQGQMPALLGQLSSLGLFTSGLKKLFPG